MEKGCFYFIKDNYFLEFTDPNLMKNKENGNRRPCFFYFKDENNIIWLIPISSKVEKFKVIYENKVKKYGYCNNIYFGEVLGVERVFLLQNMFPITEEYISEQYIYGEKPVKIKYENEKELSKLGKKILALHKSKPNLRLIIPDVFEIEKKLKENMKK